MAGAILERKLTTAGIGRVKFDVARQTDDSEIRSLLRENPIPGRISISLERDPDYFADADLPGEAKQTIVARDGGRMVSVGCCAFRLRFVNGRSLRVGYLGSLRLDARYGGRFDILRRGYEFFHQLQADAPADFYFTSIAADNQRARQFLERGVHGIPLYEFVGEFVTLLVPTCHSSRAKNARASKWKIDRGSSASADINKLVGLLNEHNNACQFAPCWSAAELNSLQPLGLEASDFCIVSNGERMAACGALWDQRSFRQTVIRQYAPSLAFVRPVFNAFARIVDQPRLPAVGETLANAFASHVATRTDEASVLIGLVEQLRSIANQRGIELLTLGFAVNNPRLATVRHNFRHREYRSRLYVVRWPDIGGAARELDDRFLAPEVALL